MIRPFRALRPPRDLVDRVSAPPYDVVDTAEARAMAVGNLDSFLRVSRPEIDLDPAATPDAEEVHQLGRKNLDGFVRRGVLVRDEEPSLLVYRQRMGDAVQTGVVGCASAQEYRSGVIATHEHTRPDKELDRTRHIDVLDAHDEPVFLMYRADAPGAADVAAALDRVTSGEPEYDLTCDDGIGHTLWAVTDPQVIQTLVTAFGQMPALYVADGHHRSAAAARIWDQRGDGEAACIMSVVFPADELTVMAYNRVVRDLGEYDQASFLRSLDGVVTVERSAVVPVPGRHQFAMYLGGCWFLLTVREEIVDESDPIARLDVSLLQEHVLAPLLGIGDPRTNQRIAFVGGIRGAAELMRLVDSGDVAVAFALHPTSTVEVMDVADLGEVMPPKSTWFEPKLRSGLFVHPMV